MIAHKQKQDETPGKIKRDLQYPFLRQQLKSAAQPLCSKRTSSTQFNMRWDSTLTGTIRGDLSSNNLTRIHRV